jgi:hypothetical protein
MCWSQPVRVDHLLKKWRPKEKKIQKEKTQGLTGTGLARGRRPAVARRPWASPTPVRFYAIYFLFYFIFWGSLGNGLGLLGEWVYNTPIF